MTSKATAPDGALAATQPSVAKALKWLTDAQSLWMHGKDGPSHQFVIEAMAELRAVETASARQKDELVAKVAETKARDERLSDLMRKEGVFGIRRNNVMLPTRTFAEIYMALAGPSRAGDLPPNPETADSRAALTAKEGERQPKEEERA